MSNVRLSFITVNRVTDPKTIRVSEWDGMNEYVSRVIWESSKKRCFGTTECFSRLSQGLEDDILESSIGRWADTAATYCPGQALQISLKCMTKLRNRREQTLCSTRNSFQYISTMNVKL